jgi:cytochrome c biogenesis protein CcmG, thiol:disulfide interchange protein DsbE
LLFLSLNVSQASGQFFFFENPLLGEAAPDFTLNTLEQQGVNLTSYRASRPAIVFFWATWCPHCREQLKTLNEKNSELTQKGIRIILVDLGEPAGQVQAYMQKNNLKFDVFLDQESSVAEAYGVVGIPTFVLIDAKGVVKAVENGIPANYEGLLLSDNSSV